MSLRVRVRAQVVCNGVWHRWKTDMQRGMCKNEFSSGLAHLQCKNVKKLWGRGDGGGPRGGAEGVQKALAHTTHSMRTCTECGYQVNEG